MTAIEWTDVTWNPVRGCSRVSPGCANCYAETMARRLATMGGKNTAAYLPLVETDEDGKPRARWSGKVVLDVERLADPLRWRKPRRVFVNSMSDMFHESLTNEQIAAVYGVMDACPQHTFQVLTKRAGRMARWFADVSDERRDTAMGRAFDLAPERRRDDLADFADHMWPPGNVWLGVSVEDQQRADERIPYLLRCPAAVRFLSVEPLLGPVDLRQVQHERDGFMRQSLDSIDWVIAGGESGPGARPMHPEWVRSLRDQCVTAGVPFFFKQWGQWSPFVDEGRFTHGGAETARNAHRWLMPDGEQGECWIFDDDGNWTNHTGNPPQDTSRMAVLSPVGKKAAGCLLDGKEWRQWPEVKP